MEIELRNIVSKISLIHRILKTPSHNNVVIGRSNVVGNDNVLIGSNNIVFGDNNVISGSNNIVLGNSYVITGNNVIKCCKIDMFILHLLKKSNMFKRV